MKDLNVEVAEVAGERITFSFGLLKAHEYFRFDALATVPSDDSDASKAPSEAPNMRLRQGLELDYRIADMHNLQRLRLRGLRMGNSLLPRISDAISRPSVRNMLRLYSAMFSPFWLGIALTLAGIGIYFISPSINSKHIAYELVGPNNQRIVIRARVKSDEIELHNREGFRKTMSTKEFDDLQKTTVLLPSDERGVIVMSSLYCGLGTLVLIAWGIRFVRTRKYRHILRLSQS